MGKHIRIQGEISGAGIFYLSGPQEDKIKVGLKTNFYYYFECPHQVSALWNRFHPYIVF